MRSVLAGRDLLGQVDCRDDLEALRKPFFQALLPDRFLGGLAAINDRLEGAHLILPKVERAQPLLACDVEEGPGRYGLRLWMLITLEIRRRIVIEGEAP